MTPERHQDELEDCPPDDELADDRRDARQEPDEGAWVTPPAERKWMDSLPPWDS